jgi:antitoxin ParD1/3/4
MTTPGRSVILALGIFCHRYWEPTMAATMNVSLTEPLKRLVDDEVREGGFASTSDYVRELIRERQRHKSEHALRALIVEGLGSGPAEPVSDDFFAKQRQRLAKA